MLPAAPSSQVHVPVPAMPSGPSATIMPSGMPNGIVNGDIALLPAATTVTLPIQEVTEATTIPNTIMNRSRSRSRSPENKTNEEVKNLVAPKTITGGIPGACATGSVNEKGK